MCLPMPPEDPVASRIALVRAAMRGFDSLLITHPQNIRYLSGFTGSSGCCLITRKEAVLVTDFRYQEQAASEAPGWDLKIEKSRVRTLLGLAKQLGIKTLGFESTVTYGLYARLKKGLGRTPGVGLKPTDGLVGKIRAVKDKAEMALIREAVERAEAAFADVLPAIRAGVTEQALARMLAAKLKAAGCEVLPFDIILASGPNSALPHARPTQRKLSPGDLVIVDWGGEAGGYYSDMTRTLLLKGGGRGGKLSKKKEIYSKVLEANKRAIAAVREGAKASDIDKQARDVINRAGYGECFGHGTGHGVGLEVHEMPHISAKGRGRLQKGMVFTVEPGIYVPGLGGVRVEDMVATGKRRAQVLTTLPKELKII